ncbi:MAG TPA: TldD/PmbA family protein, partial [Chloroflexi bacterium]|nr:TldD/PmbA family protein [Chloroflexota bacterium]
MEELAHRAMNLAEAKGATYADIRLRETETQTIILKNGVIEAIATTSSHGFGVRVIADGAWGFAASASVSRAKIDEVTTQALEIARASALAGGQPVNLGPPEVHRGQYRTPVEVDPFRVPLEDKIDLLMRCDEAMRRAKGVAIAEANMVFIRKKQLFASTEGSLIEQEIVETGAGLEATAVGEDEVQKRSHPNSFGRHQGTAGYEFVDKYDLLGHAERLGEEAVALLSARQCPTGKTTLILG